MRSFNNNLNYKYWYLDSSGVLHPIDNNTIQTTKLIVGVTASVTGSIELKGTTSGTCTITVPAIAGTPTYTLPAAVGAANTYLKDVAGNGILSWSIVAGGGDVTKVGTPVNNQVGVWTGDGTLEGDAALTYDAATDTLTSVTFAGALTGNADTATTATHLAGGSGGTIPYQSAAGTTAMLANGSAGEVLQSNGTTLAPSWVAAGAGDMILASVQSVTGLKTFDTIKLAVKGSSTGSTAIASANAGATDYTQTLQARTGTVANLDNVTFIGTTSVALNRASAALVLTGITSIDGSSATCVGLAGSATILATTRAIYGNNFDGSAPLTGIIASTYGGTGNGFTKFTGATTAEKTYTLPDASSTLLYSGGALGTPSGGTATNITGLPIAGLVASTVTALGVGSVELGHATDTTLARVSAGLVSIEGVNILTTATGAAIGQTMYIGTTGVAINRTSAALTLAGITLTTPDIGTPSAGTLTSCTGLPAAAVVAGSLVANMEASDHGTAATDMLVNVCYGTGAAPTASTTTEGTLYIKYTA